MAKQTFTTGSVLTATQMNNLQANDYNWTVSQKTASYVLAAADAGTRIEMNAAGSTTVTVNTGLFTAGDSVIIQNIGAGTCTITAGTATVNKATNASLALAQYQGGTLYFVSASNAIFFPFDVGASASGAYTLLETITFNGSASYTSATIPGTYRNIEIVVRDFLPATDGTQLALRLNGISTSSYNDNQSAGSQTFGKTYCEVTGNSDNVVANGLCIIAIEDYANAVTSKFIDCRAFTYNSTTSTNSQWNYNWSCFNSQSAITTVTLFAASGNITSGSALIYGVS